MEKIYTLDDGHHRRGLFSDFVSYLYKCEECQTARTLEKVCNWIRSNYWSGVSLGVYRESVDETERLGLFESTW